MARPSQQIDRALLAAGRVLLPETGCARLSVRALAERARVAPGMFHYHFGSKERFLRALLAGLYEEMFSSLSQQVAQPAQPLERLRAVLRLLARFARANRRLLARLWTDAMAGEPVARDFFRDHAPRHMGVVLQLLGQAQEAGALRALPPLQCFALVLGAGPLPMIFVAGLVDAGFVLPGGKPAFDAQVMTDDAIDARIDLLLDALKPVAAPTRIRR
ncbi:MAG: TetR family transcriptional regulator [Aquincola sp.]|nr:TetR family transcriptional regulator [Aquincola sp.]MDH4287781.1 TetR family transcriptional regulator [Aquincola sp.]MDH5328433.1 TetR family transcriptional regulator [Aquincola sp.]